jgi:hypothetical protein
LFVSLAHSLALKFGYSNVAEMKKDSQKRFSLLENGILDKPSTKTLIINVGVVTMADVLFPLLTFL